MQRKLLFMFVSFVALCVDAQDIIIKRNGDEVQAKVSKISDLEIEYKKWSNLNGPSYTIKTNEVFMIKYENGEKDVFEGKNTLEKNQTQQDESNRLSIDNIYNQKALSCFNQFDIKYIGSDTDKQAKRALWIFGLTKTSIIADENVEISFDMGYFKDKASLLSKGLNWEFFKSPLGVANGNVVREPAIRVIVKNKSSKTIFIDFGNSFVRRGDKTHAYYIPEAVTVSNSSGSGIGTGLGVVSVGVGVSTSNSTTTYSQRVKAIPPKSSIELSPNYLMYDLHKTKNLKDNMDSDYNISGISLHNYNGVLERVWTLFSSLNRGECLNYTEEACPFRFCNIISYSFSEQCNSLVQLCAELYIKDIIGVESGKPEKIEEVLPGISNMLAFPSYFEKVKAGGYPRP